MAAHGADLCARCRARWRGQGVNRPAWAMSGCAQLNMPRDERRNGNDDNRNGQIDRGALNPAR